MELDIGRVPTQPVRKSARDVGGKELVLRAGDVQDRGADRMILVLLPVLGNAAADADDASRFARMGSDQTIVQPHRLRKAHQQGSMRRDRKAGAKLFGNGLHYLMVKANIQFRVAARAPVVSDLV